MCILFYCSSKVLPSHSACLHQVIIYLFLIERVHIVRGGTKTRMQDKVYLFNLVGLVPYCVIVILAIVFRYNNLDDTGRCFIGLRRESSFPLLIYDLVINVFTLYSGSNSDLSYGSISPADARIILLQSRSKSTSSASGSADFRYFIIISY